MQQPLDVSKLTLKEIDDFFGSSLSIPRSIRYSDKRFEILKIKDPIAKKRPNVIEIQATHNRNMRVEYNEDSAIITEYDRDRNIEIEIRITRFNKKWQNTTAKIKFKEFQIEFDRNSNKLPVVKYQKEEYKIDNDTIIYEGVTYKINENGQLTYNNCVVDENFINKLIEDKTKIIANVLKEIEDDSVKKALDKWQDAYRLYAKENIEQKIEKIRYVLDNLDEIKKLIENPVFSKEELDSYIEVMNNYQPKKIGDAILLDQLTQLVNISISSKKQYRIIEDGIRIKKAENYMSVGLPKDIDIEIAQNRDEEVKLIGIALMVKDYNQTLIIRYDDNNGITEITPEDLSIDNNPDKVRIKYLDMARKEYDSCKIQSDDVSKIQIRTHYNRFNENEFVDYAIGLNTISFGDIEFRINKDGCFELTSDKSKVDYKPRNKEEEKIQSEIVMTKTNEILDTLIRENKLLKNSLKEVIEEQTQIYMIEKAAKEAERMLRLSEDIRSDILLPKYNKRELSTALSLIERQEALADENAVQYKKVNSTNNQ